MNLPRLLSPLALLLATAAAAADETPPVTELEPIEVIARSPTGPADGRARDASSNVQGLDEEQLAHPGLRSIGDALEGLGSVFRSDATGGAFQPDLFYRGYSLSPLLGLPQGLAVYLDGVRINEPFGDTVNLDLVPLVALSGASLVPGSNPLYGRNALGGAIALRTKNGFDDPGLGAQLDAGQYGRRGGALEGGASDGRTALYGAAELQREDGWRDFSESQVQRLFGRASWRPDAATQLDLSLSAADNRLRGNGAAPRELIEAEGRETVFTNFDETRSRLLFATVSGSRRFDGGATLSGNLYARRNRQHSYNGDGTEFEECSDPANVNADGDPLLCEIDGDSQSVLTARDGTPVVADEANDSATRNRGRTGQDGYGLSAQWAQAFGAHRLAVGLGLDLSDIDFSSDTELARLTATRGTLGSGVHTAESLVRVKSRNDSYGVYLLDTWQAQEQLVITAAGRWSHDRIKLRDQIPGGDLSGDHRFSRFNPMLGYAWTLAPGWVQFGSLAQAARTPTPVELTCANPDDPCRLPNGFVDDPPLDQVVTRTAELGLRHRHAGFSASAAVFHAVSRDDILFITDGSLTNQGYFDNVGKTLRQGAELQLEWTLGGGFTAQTQLTVLNAEFREAFLVNTPNHPLRDALDPGQPDAATRQVSRGDRIPLIPRYQARAALDWSGGQVDAGLEWLARGSSRFRGDEANVDTSRLGAFGLFNATLGLRMTPAASLDLHIDNLFNRHYETFGVYGEADEVLGDDYEDARRFVGVGSPRTLGIGLRLTF